jgi:hypothetical protein
LASKERYDVAYWHETDVPTHFVEVCY